MNWGGGSTPNPPTIPTLDRTQVNVETEVMSRTARPERYLATIANYLDSLPVGCPSDSLASCFPIDIRQTALRDELLGVGFL